MQAMGGVLLPEWEGKFNDLFKGLQEAIAKQQAEASAKAAVLAASSAAVAALSAPAPKSGPADADAEAEEEAAAAEGTAAACASFLGPHPTTGEAKSLAEGLRSALVHKAGEQGDPIEPWDSDIFKPPVFRSGLLENAKAARQAKKATQYRDTSRTPPPSKRKNR